ncbi:hypothetical protein BAUCODRAFT_571914 [Baudoinia panamericana UAMH 10762]|uniref:Probable lysine--tRNA ligase, cytoplasmic n=1 Tax=Baudoinia panamericana (strain UAMH 10762) TaxID=717646 RepID=M2NJW0_BAUPA|nr:uncharacterized protein BAUCODRAFT_571914 [Baudoinia panamericana UAMH 10762]EMC99714.1 hypothetical protein BAUCODRAFT_571914 [Baudoinia panamericana UAMH 10762]
MSDEPRRSGRATKGTHSSAKASSSPAPTLPKGAKTTKSKGKKAAQKAEDDEGDNEEGEIRCICGDTDAKSTWEFIGCEACLSWQHNVCMGEPPEGDPKLPEHYFCEECRPEEHKETLAALAKGEKIWETRQTQFKQWRKMSASRRKGKAKDGEEVKPKYLKAEYTDGEVVEPAETEAGASDSQEAGTKRKLEEIVPEEDASEEQPVVSSRRADKRRKSSQATSKAIVDAETAVVEIDQLPNDRKKIAQALSDVLSTDIGERAKAGYRIPDGQTAKSIGERHASLIEYALYQNHGGPQEEKYKAQFRALHANLKRNRVLVERLLEDSLTADELATMESKDMASEEQQLERKRMKEELDRQAVAIQEEGPRFRQDHKGVEKIEEDRVAASEFAANIQPVRERTSIAEDGSDVPMNVDGQQDSNARTATEAGPGLDRRESSQANFDINNIWQKTTGSAQSPTTAAGRRPMQIPPRRRSSMQIQAEASNDGAKDDPDVDRLLQDDDEQYEPSDLTDGVVWRGKLVHAGEGEPVVNARWVAGRDMSSTAPWRQMLPSKLTVDGRLAVPKAEEYLCGLQWSQTSDVSVLALSAYDDIEAFNRVFMYFSSRQRYAVINKDKPPLVKDLYVIPVEKGKGLPEHVNMLEHCTLKSPAEERMLLATFVIARAMPPAVDTAVQPQQQQTASVSNGGPQHLPQHVRAGGPGPAGSPLNQNNPTFSPSQQHHPAMPTAGYGAPVGQQPGAAFPPNPYEQQTPQQQQQQAPLAFPLSNQPQLPPNGNPLIAEILGPRLMDPTAQQIIQADPNVDAAKLHNLRSILDEDVNARTDLAALAVRLNASGTQAGVVVVASVVSAASGEYVAPLLKLPHTLVLCMSAQQTADAVKDAVQNVADKVQEMTTADGAPTANQLLDEETGEYVSKTELKKRQKQREKEKQKAEREATRQPPPAPKRKAGPVEEDLNPNQYFEIRSRAIKRMKEDGSMNPFPHKFEENYELPNFEKEFGHLKKGETKKEITVKVICRVYNIRTSGENLRFYEVEADGAQVQIMATNMENTSEKPFADQHDPVRRGDWLGVIGFPGRTSPKREDNPGELSIFAQEVIVLSPCLHQIPSEHYGFRDQEERHRNRHLDLIMNKRTVDTFIKRTKIIRYVRNYLDSNGFLEMETPILMKNAGGATAKPFMTHHNDLNMMLALRIATELPLKMLIVGGFRKVYEVGRLFRNEGIDLTHNPEFTTCEFYERGADLYDTMNRTEELVEGMVKEICGSNKTTFITQHGETYNVDWSRPWKRIEMMPALEEACGEAFPPGDQLHTEETNAFLKRMLAKTGVDCTPPLTNSRMIDKLVGEFIEEKCVNPTFITGHPQMMSPLAKYHRSLPGICERAEAFVCKKEIANMYTELNDPFDQRLRFEEQARQKAQGDDEAQVLDEGFLTAMEYGLPPTGGWGMGIDRMVMFLTNNYSIKEVLTFPFMKDENVAPRPKAAEVADVEAMPVEEVGHK